MVRTLVASYWADTGTASFDAMAPKRAWPGQMAAAPPPVAAPVAGMSPHSHRRPQLVLSRGILGAIAACTPGRSMPVEPSAGTPPTLEAVAADRSPPSAAATLAWSDQVASTARPGSETTIP